MRDRLRNREVFAQAGITPRVRTNDRGWLMFTVSTAKLRTALHRSSVSKTVKNRIYQMLLTRKHGG
jgi:hypothetical protein